MLSKLIIFWMFPIYLGVLHLTLSAELRCYKGSLDSYDVSPLDQAGSFLNRSWYNSSRRTVFYAFGYRGSPEGNGSRAMIGALLEVLDANICIFDDTKELSSATNDSVSGVAQYPNAALVEAPLLGEEFGTALTSMAKNGLNLSSTQLIGHSLGAHICGNAGRTVKKNQLLIGRITGLDPAGPFFDNPQLTLRLDNTTADFVDCVHTDYGRYGVNTSTCDQDTYINKTADNVQPGCPVGTFAPLTYESLCSHNRAWQVCADALRHQKSLIGCSAKNYSDWLAGKCDTQKRSYVCDINADTSATGNFFIHVTNPQSIYGQGEDGLEPY